MRITQFNQPRMAQAFVDYMATRGITLRIEHENHYVIMLDDESKISLVENELQQFLHDLTIRVIRPPAGIAEKLTVACAMSAAISGRISVSVPVR